LAGRTLKNVVGYDLRIDEMMRLGPPKDTDTVLLFECDGIEEAVSNTELHSKAPPSPSAAYPGGYHAPMKARGTHGVGRLVRRGAL
jgi:hypothetical protein